MTTNYFACGKASPSLRTALNNAHARMQLLPRGVRGYKLVSDDCNNFIAAVYRDRIVMSASLFAGQRYVIKDFANAVKLEV